MAISEARPRRPVKVRGGTLGPFLCWAVVFADIGTSIYYTPGILYGQVGGGAALFVLMTLFVFMLLVLKYQEVAWRYPEGGGVVTVATRAIHPFAGLVGGLFIQVDYFLTAAISALSGFVYLSVVAPKLGPLVTAATVVALLVLGTLNLIGIKESAGVSAAIAILAGVFQLVVVVVVAVSLGLGGVIKTITEIGNVPNLGPIGVLVGFSGAFLAFSGLESISQLSPAMAEPRRQIAARALMLVVGTMVVTSPLLTLWSTTLLDVKHFNGDQLNEIISLLGGKYAGPWLAGAVAVSGSLLLVFASNTAIIGSYHVFLALGKMGFLPEFITERNRLRGTPHWAILISVGIPLVVVVLAQGNLGLLGDLYAFGLLGAFTMTSLSLDIVRWHDRGKRTTLLAHAGYGLGVVTTALVGLAWTTNLFSKPLATVFGGGVVVLGLLISLVNVRYGQHRGRPLVLPLLLRPNHRIVPISGARQLEPARVMAVLPHDPERLDAVIQAAIKSARREPITFFYRGHRLHEAEVERGLFEVRDPYLEDRRAQRAFARADILARAQVPDRRYAYVPGDVRAEAIEDMIRSLDPDDIIVADGEQRDLPTMALGRVRVSYEGEIPVLHLKSGRPSHRLRLA